MHYHRPDNLNDALRLKAETPGSRWIAGGTDLMVRLREGRVGAPALVSLRGIAELTAIEVGDPTRLGAMAPVSDLLAHEELSGAFPVLAQAARTLGSVQIRNCATVGGNLCNASPCADLAPPLLVHDARVRIAGPAGERELPLDDFFLSPGETRLRADELLIGIVVDRPAHGTRAVFFKKGRVRMDIALASVCVSMRLEGARCVHARVAAGSVAPRPLRLPAVEAVLANAELTESVIGAARDAARESVSPITDVRATADYRRHVVGVFVERAVRALAEGRPA